MVSKTKSSHKVTFDLKDTVLDNFAAIIQFKSMPVNNVFEKRLSYEIVKAHLPNNCPKGIMGRS